MMYKLVSIDAWRDDFGWSWNDVWKVEDKIYIEDDTTTRQLLKFMRRNKWLTEQSKGKVRVDWDNFELIEIQDRNTGRPLLAFLPSDQEAN